MPDGAGAVVGDEHAAVIGDCDTYWPAPDLAVFRDKASEEVFVASLGMAIVRGDADDFVAGAAGTVPGAVLGGEGVAFIGRGKLLVPGWVEGHLKRSHVGLNQHVGSDDLGGKVDAGPDGRPCNTRAIRRSRLP